MVNRKNIIEQIVENRIALGNKYIQQSLPIMSINEAFNPSANILTNLVNKNKQTWNIIKNEMPAVWTDITDEMITVYNKEELYNVVKDIFGDDKSIAKAGKHYGMMIFTDSDDIIKYVLAGKQANSDCIYVANDLEDLLSDRYKMMKKAHDDFKTRYNINLGSFARGTKDQESTPLTLQQFVGKVLFDVAAAYNDKGDRTDTISIWKDASKVYQVLRGINSSNWVNAPTRFTKKAVKNNMSAGDKNTNDSFNFSKSILEYPDAYKFAEMLDPKLLRTLLRLANVRTSSMAKAITDPAGNQILIPIYGDNEFINADDDELCEMYDTMRDINVRNSLLFNFSTIKDIRDSNMLTAFGQLALVPDKVSHLYYIHNLATTTNRDLDTIEDIETPDYTGGKPMDIEDRYNIFKSDTAADERRRNWDVGTRSGYSKWNNEAGNVAKSVEEIRKLRALRRSGMEPRSIDNNEIKSRLARSAEWEKDAEHKRFGHMDSKFNANRYNTKHEKTFNIKNPKLAAYYTDFMNYYDSFIDNTKDTFTEIITLCQPDYEATKEIRNAIFNYCILLKAAVEAAHTKILANEGNVSMYNSFLNVLSTTGSDSKGYFTKYLEFMRIAKKMLKKMDTDAFTKLIEQLKSESYKIRYTLNGLTADSKDSMWYITNAKKFYKA